MSRAVDVARLWARAMVQRESRGTGDTKNAMKRLSERYGLDYNLFWKLRYRPPSDLFTETFDKLRGAYENELRRAERALDHERKLTEAKSEITAGLVRAAAFVAGEENRRADE